MRPMPMILCALMAAPACGAATFSDDFQSYTTGAFPGGPWYDAGTAAVPAPPMPTGHVIDTTGPDGSPTKAFQVFQQSTTSQGIMSTITPATTHRVEADIRVDIHPTPVRYANWTASMGFFQLDGAPIDFNAAPQGVVYVYNAHWWFYGYTSGANYVNVQLGATPVDAGAWYHVALSADTTDGSFSVTVADALGTELISQELTLPGYSAALGQYNRVALFDGEYSNFPATPGQFTADNVSYIPAPAGALPLVTIGFAGRRRRRG